MANQIFLKSLCSYFSFWKGEKKIIVERDNDSLCEFVFWANPCEVTNWFIVSFCIVLFLCLDELKFIVWIKGKVKANKGPNPWKKSLKTKKNITNIFISIHIISCSTFCIIFPIIVPILLVIYWFANSNFFQKSLRKNLTTRIIKFLLLSLIIFSSKFKPS